MGLDEIFGLLILVAFVGVVIGLLGSKIPMQHQFRWLFDLIVWCLVVVIGVVVVYWVVILLLAMVGIHPRLPGRL